MVMAFYLMISMFLTKGSKLCCLIILESISVIMICLFLVKGGSASVSIFLILMLTIFLVLESVFGMSLLLSSHRGAEKEKFSFNCF